MSEKIDLSKKIPIKEYAEKIGKDYGYLLRKCRTGGFETAIKIGTQWFIDADEPYIDRRVKSGGYVKIRQADHPIMRKNKYGPKNSSLHDIYLYKLLHPDAAISEIATALGISTATVSKWWQAVISLINSQKDIDNSQ